MSQYVFLQVKEVIKETAEAVTVVFTKPTVITNYKSGQFLTLILTIAGEKLRRSYSLSSSPYVDEDWAVTVKKIPGGKMSTYIVDKVKAGDIIETMAPMGTFTYEPNASTANDIVLIGAGSGITPLFSILSSTLAIEKDSTIHLIYANRNEASVILNQGLERIKMMYNNRFHYTLVFSKPSNPSAAISGRLDETKIIKVLENFEIKNLKQARYFVCGPQGMMHESFLALETLGVSQENIHKESFTSALPHEDSSTIAATADKAESVVVDIKYNKQVYNVKVESYQTILEAALAQGIDLPYSCQSGMCTACMGKCKTGQVKMDDPDGLSANEIKQGLVLICVSKPIGSGVMIEID